MKITRDDQHAVGPHAVRLRKRPGKFQILARVARLLFEQNPAFVHTARQQGVLSGCNVVMPNLSPMAVRQKYLLYDNKAGIGDDGESSLRKLRAQMQEIGYEVAVGRGDYTDGRTKQ